MEMDWWTHRIWNLGVVQSLSRRRVLGLSLPTEAMAMSCSGMICLMILIPRIPKGDRFRAKGDRCRI